MQIIGDTVGIIGVILILVAYFMLHTEKLKPTDYSYSIVNLIGALMILFSIIYAWNIAAFFIEAAWAIISGYGIWKKYKMEKASTQISP